MHNNLYLLPLLLLPAPIKSFITLPQQNIIHKNKYHYQYQKQQYAFKNQPFQQKLKNAPVNESLNRHNTIKITERKRLYFGIAIISFLIITLYTLHPLPVFATTINSIKPFYVDKSTNTKIWLKDASKSPEMVIKEITKQPVLSFFERLKNSLVDMIRFMNIVGSSFMKRFLPYLFLFTLLPASFNRGHSFFRMNSTMKMLDFLEGGDIFQFSLENPLKGEIVFKKQVYKSKDNNGVMYHVTINHDGNLRYLEGQSIGICIPTDKGELKEQRFPIASSRYGDDKKGKTLSICIPNNSPISSMKSGDAIKITGPYNDSDYRSSKLLYPEQKENNFDIIMITSKANNYSSLFRSYLHRLFIDNTRIRYSYKGSASLLFLDGNDEQNMFSNVIYGNELEAIENDYPDNFEVYSLIKDDSIFDSIISKLNNGAYLYISGADDMYKNVKELLKKEYNKKVQPEDFEDWLANLEKNQQFHLLIN